MRQSRNFRWIRNSLVDEVCVDALSGGALDEFAVMAEPSLSRCVNIFAIIAGSVMQAIILTLLLSHTSHIVTSILNTRLNLCAQLILRAWYGLSESVTSSANRALFLPRCEAVTCARTLALGRIRRKTEYQGLSVVANSVQGEVALGQPELFTQLDINITEILEHDVPIAGLSLNGEFLACFLLADTLCTETKQALADLRELDIGRQLLLTGDRQSVAFALAQKVGLTEVIAQALTEDKLKQVTGEIRKGFKPLVVGDGINDSLALKAGVVGVAMGAGGSDITLAS